MLTNSNKQLFQVPRAIAVGTYKTQRDYAKELTDTGSNHLINGTMWKTRELSLQYQPVLDGPV